MPTRPIFTIGRRRGLELYGRAIKQNDDGTWPTDDKGRFLFVEGIEAYVQGLRIGLQTFLGTRPLAPDAGTWAHRIVGRRKGPDAITLGLLRFEVIRFLRTDPRTDEIERVDLSYAEDGAIRCTAWVRPVNHHKAILIEAELARLGVI